MTVTIRTLCHDDAPVFRNMAPGVFDDPLDARRTAEFLADPRHHLVVAIENGLIIGCVTAVHYIHPDKTQPELWLNEIGVAPTHRKRGVGRDLVRHVLELGRGLGCDEAWVITERSNAASMRLFARSGGTKEADDSVVLAFDLTGTGSLPQYRERPEDVR